MATSREMTSGRPFPLILNFAFPLLLGNLLQQTYSLMDAAIVGKFLGINALASVGASTSVVFLILGFCNGCCGGFGIPVAQKFGARDYGMMRRFVAVSLQLAAVMSVVIAIVTSMFCSDILQMMQTPENILEDAYLYLLITFIGVPCTFFYNLLSSIIRALGDSKTPFWFLLFSTILNILLDLFCILILDWGVAGAAVATVFSQGVSAVLCYLYMMRHFEILKGTPTEHKFRGALAKTLLYIGVPMGLQFSITAIGSIMLQSANNALGTACVAAFTAAMRIKMFCMCPLESLGIAMATYSVLLIAKNKEVHQHLQAQFKNRMIKKRYIALLDGKISSKEGTIILPLRMDPLDRPRQVVDHEHGKTAITQYQVLNEQEGNTLIAFYPLTGRTHQLRVHAAHPEGLHCPIRGDELYGQKADRLYLHAESLEFVHPVTKEIIFVEKKSNF